MKRFFNVLTTLSPGIVLLAMAAMVAAAQTFTVVHRFDLVDGDYPYAALVQGTDGNLYGTTDDGGTTGPFSYGTIFKITPDGTFTSLYTFCPQMPCTDGNSPRGLALAASGDFYGVAANGGLYDWGTVFRFSPGGKLSLLYSFCSQGGTACTDGASPVALVLAASGELYGTASEGGNIIPNGSFGAGTVFKITPAGALTTIYRFCGQPDCPDAANPGPLVQTTSGDFYGVTYFDESAVLNTVFKITPDGTLTNLSTFCAPSTCLAGYGATGLLIQATDGDLYGTTYSGGAYGGGAVYKITPDGVQSGVYDFCAQTGCPDGATPNAALVEGTDGNFYGTTIAGGANNAGTVFRVTPSGTLTTLYNFCANAHRPNCPDGWDPHSALVQSTNGDFFGNTSEGGLLKTCESGCGTIFRLSAGLPPFVKALPHSAKAGDTISILGSDLAGTTAVSFSGAAAAFSVVSATQITATVPAGATTGKIQVTTPGGVLSSAGPFFVR